MVNIHQLIPRNSGHLSAILSFILLGRETEVAIRNNGYLSVFVKSGEPEMLKYIKTEMNTEIREYPHFPDLMDNIYLSNYPKYFFISFFPFIIETALMSQLGDTCVIRTRRFSTRIPGRKWIYGNKLEMSPYLLQIYLPFLAREYISRDGKQGLSMDKGYRMVVTQQEIRTFLGKEEEDGLLAI